MKDDLDDPRTLSLGNLSPDSLVQHIDRVLEFHRLPLQISYYVNKSGTSLWLEDLHVSRMLSWLGRHVHYAVSANHISPEKVTSRQRQDQLWPSRNIICLISQLKREIPDDLVISLHALV